jgi:hypothetical protein
LALISYPYALTFNRKILAKFRILFVKGCTNYFIEAMKDTIVLSINYGSFMANTKRSMIWNSFAKKYTEKIYSEKEKREVSLLKEAWSKQYANILKEYKQLIGRIPLKDMASFLGSPRFLYLV